MNLNYYLTQKLLTKVIFNFKLMQTSWNIWVTYITYVRLAGWKDLSLFKGILTIMIEYYIYLLYLQFSHEEDTLTWKKNPGRSQINVHYETYSSSILYIHRHRYLWNSLNIW